jgi:hypothetical protein
MKKTLLEPWPKMKRGDFLGCSVSSTACIESERTARLLGSACTKVTKEAFVVWY